MPPVTVSFVNMENIFALRDIRSEHIGRLISISGTVTRTTDVKPELLSGTFTCDLCGTRILSVDQQFQFTKPTACTNESCNNRTKFTFDIDGSVFTDWQRIKLQENTNEIPAGSMPRSLDLILRDSLVESVKPGDKVVAVGSFIVIPDISQLSSSVLLLMNRSRQGQVPVLHSNGMNDQGITGLAGLGVRNMTYCSVISSYVDIVLLSSALPFTQRPVLRMRIFWVWNSLQPGNRMCWICEIQLCSMRSWLSQLLQAFMVM